MVIQVNGKFVEKITIPRDADVETAMELVSSSQRTAQRLEGANIVDTVVKLPKVVNFVVAK